MGYRKAVIIGAGKIGRGLIAGILRTNGIEYCFIETDPALIRQFRENSQYLLHILGGREQIIPMRTVPIYALFETAEIEKRLLEADLIFTAVGGRNLREVGEFLGERLEHILPERSWARALNMIVHENWKYKDSDLSENIQKKLSRENQSLFQDMVGICTAISTSFLTSLLSSQTGYASRKTLLFLFPSLFAHLLQMLHRFQQLVHLRPGRELRQQFADFLEIASLSLGVVLQCVAVALQILPLRFRRMVFGRRCQLLRRKLRRGLYHLRRSVLLQQLVHR